VHQISTEETMESTTLLGSYRVLVTGGTGSWGNELVRQIVDDPTVKEITIYSRGELQQVQMKRAFRHHLDKLTFMIGDVRDLERLRVATKGVDKVFHMAALKHVPVCEENPWEAVQTNITGTNNVIEASIQNDVRRVVFVSTDKAVDPLNLYGVTKSCAEKLIVSANMLKSNTTFVCLRAGNVLGTSGSVVPLFIEEIRKANTITLTHAGMSRFFLRLEDAIRLVLKAERDAVGGEITVVKMPSCKIVELAEVLIEEVGNEDTRVVEIGIRPGEKIYEVLISKYETSRVVSAGEWFIILPMLELDAVSRKYAGAPRADLTQEYSSKSSDQLTKDGIRQLLRLGGFLEKDYRSSFSDMGPDDLLNYFRTEGWLKSPAVALESDLNVA